MKSKIRTNKRKTRRRGGSNLSAAPAVTAPAVVPIKNTAAPSAAPVVASSQASPDTTKSTGWFSWLGWGGSRRKRSTGKRSTGKRSTVKRSTGKRSTGKRSTGK